MEGRRSVLARQESSRYVIRHFVFRLPSERQLINSRLGVGSRRLEDFGGRDLRDRSGRNWLDGSWELPIYKLALDGEAPVATSGGRMEESGRGSLFRASSQDFSMVDRASAKCRFAGLMCMGVEP